MLIRLKNRIGMSKFLPNTLDTFDCLSANPIDEVLTKIPQSKNFLGIPRWRRGTYNETHWVKLNALNKYLLLPVISFKKSKNESGFYKYAGEIKHTTLSKIILQLWLFMTLVVYSVFSAYIAFEYVFGDGLIAYTHNGVEQPALKIFPWIGVFLAVHFIGFFIYPAVVITMGWRKTIALRDEILKEIPISQNTVKSQR
ncbi:MAG: hypothetical protein JKY46_04900 [Robiginitomaculum sp.]|nr:hypothetical protein [Robiginitomaculum sp.]